MNPILPNLTESLAADRFGENRTRWADKLIAEQIELRELLPILEVEGKVPMYFTWLLGEIVERAPEMLVPVLPDLFALREKLEIQGYRRSLGKWMYHAGLPAGREGEAVDALFSWARDPLAQISTRRFAMLVLCEQVSTYPDLAQEVRLVLMEQRNLHSQTFRKTVDRMLAGLG